MSCGRQWVQTHRLWPLVRTDQDRLLLRSPADKAALRDIGRPPFLFAGVGGGLVKQGRLAGLDGQRPRRTDGQAKAGAIAQFLADHPRFAVDQLNGPFSAG